MFTRYPKRLFLLSLVIPACVVLPCRSAPGYVFSQDFNLPIPAFNDPHTPGKGDMKDAVIDVTSHISISDLDIAVTLEHEAYYDLEIVLKSPAGTTITLNPSLNSAFTIKGPGGSRSAGGSNRFLFDDEAAVAIDKATPPFDRAFKPKTGSVLSALDGQDACGRWCIQIQDVSLDHTGHLEKVELFISSPEPTTVLLFGLSAVIARSLSKRRSRATAAGGQTPGNLRLRH